MNWLSALKVYTRRDVLIVMLLGFSSGLPLALSGSTLQFWLSESKVDLTTLGLFTLVGTPYVLKFFWAPVIDAVTLPFLGRRRGWLFLTQVGLTLSLFIMAQLDPNQHLFTIAIIAFVIAFFSASQDVVIDSLRVETLAADDQAAGAAVYVAAYRVAMLLSGAGFFFFVTHLETQGFTRLSAWQGGYVLMLVTMIIGFIACFMVKEPTSPREKASILKTAKVALTDFLTTEKLALVLAFIILFKLCDALAGAMTAPFIYSLGFTRNEYAAIVKLFGTLATIFGGLAGGVIAKKYSLATSLWIAAILQMLSNLAFAGLALVGKDHTALTIVIAVENFTGGIGSVIFVAYLSSLCKNPLHTATQFALLSAFAAISRTYLAAGSGAMALYFGWIWFFVVTAIAALPSLWILHKLFK
jgi:MFS transporter, PAT family, beta-lactamase induction signal transducer AmpG